MLSLNFLPVRACYRDNGSRKVQGLIISEVAKCYLKYTLALDFTPNNKTQIFYYTILKLYTALVRNFPFVHRGKCIYKVLYSMVLNITLAVIVCLVKVVQQGGDR